MWSCSDDNVVVVVGDGPFPLITTAVVMMMMMIPSDRRRQWRHGAPKKKGGSSIPTHHQRSVQQQQQRRRRRHVGSHLFNIVRKTEGRKERIDVCFVFLFVIVVGVSTRYQYHTTIVGKGSTTFSIVYSSSVRHYDKVLARFDAPWNLF